jgi:hypothetical protein
MAKRKMMSNTPAQGGVRRRATRAPVSQKLGNNTIVKYSAIGNSISTSASGYGYPVRHYIPGYPTNLSNTIGANLVGYYSTAKFLPGTKIRWEPSVSFTTTGRVFVGFTDNPEVIATLENQRVNAQGDYILNIKGLEDIQSFPIWQETEVAFPTKMRRKRFDINQTATIIGSPDVVDRSEQIAMFALVEGAPSNTAVGSFWFHDVIDVEGIQPFIT